MKLYHIYLDAPTDYDSYDQHVICAESEEKVREIAAHHAADEGPDIWHSERAIVTEIGIPTGEHKQRIICSSFNAG